MFSQLHWDGKNENFYLISATRLRAGAVLILNGNKTRKLTSLSDTRKKVLQVVNSS